MFVSFKKDQPFNVAYLAVVRRMSPKTVLTLAILGPHLSFSKELSSGIYALHITETWMFTSSNILQNDLNKGSR